LIQEKMEPFKGLIKNLNSKILLYKVGQSLNSEINETLTMGIYMNEEMKFPMKKGKKIMER